MGMVVEAEAYLGAAEGPRTTRDGLEMDISSSSYTSCRG